MLICGFTHISYLLNNNNNPLEEVSLVEEREREVDHCRHSDAALREILREGGGIDDLGMTMTIQEHIHKICHLFTSHFHKYLHVFIEHVFHNIVIHGMGFGISKMDDRNQKSFGPECFMFHQIHVGMARTQTSILLDAQAGKKFQKQSKTESIFFEPFPIVLTVSLHKFSHTDQTEPESVFIEESIGQIKKAVLSTKLGGSEQIMLNYEVFSSTIGR